MQTIGVGAGILSVITESLYDKPIVVFREYVQNSVDSFRKIEKNVDTKILVSKIWETEKDLYFLDNGIGIQKDRFNNVMRGIAISEKKRINDIGYKGIGRLSGLPYCHKLTFINICSYKHKNYQKFTFDGEKYNEIKIQMNFNNLGIKELIDQIGQYTDEVTGDELDEIQFILDNHRELFAKQDTGFLVILKNITPILRLTMDKKDDFISELGWLLPVKFKDELFKTDKKELFKEMTEGTRVSVIPAKSYNIYFNDIQLERPITADMLRNYTCKTNFLEYAIGFHSFYRDKIAITRSNKFSGIKLYLDNVLLCDETELIPILQRYGLIEHSSPYELIQSVKGMGAIIYIIDKINISANARRTFIEVIDTQSLEFLQLLAEFVSSIYNARYALSKYSSVKDALNQSKEKIAQLLLLAHNVRH